MIEISNATTTQSTTAPTIYVAVPRPIDYVGSLPAAIRPEPTAALSPSSEPSSYEERYRIEGDLGGGLYLCHQLTVRVWIEGSEFVAEQPDLRLHTFGEDQTEAILNLRDEIADHYSRLENLGERLSPALKRDRAFLRKLLGRNA